MVFPPCRLAKSRRHMVGPVALSVGTCRARLSLAQEDAGDHSAGLRRSEGGGGAPQTHESPHFCGLSASRGAGICRRYVRGRSPWTHPGPLQAWIGKKLSLQSGRGDLNPGPPEPHSGALPDCATPRCRKRIDPPPGRRRYGALPGDATGRESDKPTALCGRPAPGRSAGTLDSIRKPTRSLRPAGRPGRSSPHLPRSLP